MAIVRSRDGERQRSKNRIGSEAFQDEPAKRNHHGKVQQEMATPVIDIYTKFGCSFCFRAKRLLDSKGVDYNEFDITMGGPKRDEMMERAPMARTVPQIFIGDTYVGGSDDLHALEREGKLDALIAG